MRLVGFTALALLLGAGVSGRAAEAPADPAFRATLQRPLFSPTRRPPPPAPASFEPPAAVEAPAMPNLSLSGIIAGGGGGVALVRRPQDAAPVRVALGGKIDGWTLAEIRPRAIVLRRDARSVTVDLAAGMR